MRKGRHIYVPPRFLDELDNVKIHYDYKKNSEALNKIAEITPIAREFEKIREKFVLYDLWGKKKNEKQKVKH